MTGLSLEAISSYVRDLSSSCSALLLVEDLLFAGSHDGLLVSWDASSGVERWRVSISGPISDISVDSGGVYVTASDSLHAVDICLLYTSPSPRDVEESRMPSSA